MSKVLEKLRSHKKVQYIDDFRNVGDSIIISLNPGWRFGFDELWYNNADEGDHVEGTDTVNGARDLVSKAVPCNCKECREKEI